GGPGDGRCHGPPRRRIGPGPLGGGGLRRGGAGPAQGQPGDQADRQVNRQADLDGHAALPIGSGPRRAG
ncbi:hypothetical protein FV218_14615, partial [Methylobacterium sp. WL69]